MLFYHVRSAGSAGLSCRGAWDCCLNSSAAPEAAKYRPSAGIGPPTRSDARSVIRPVVINTLVVSHRLPEVRQKLM